MNLEQRLRILEKRVGINEETKLTPEEKVIERFIKKTTKDLKHKNDEESFAFIKATAKKMGLKGNLA